MNAPARDDLDAGRLRAFLLGRLPEAEREALEARFFEDDACYEHLLDVQNELVDEYVREMLPLDERREVEMRLLAHPEGERRARVARALAAMARREATAQSRAGTWWPPGRAFAAAAAVALVSASSAAWLAVDNGRLRRELETRAASAVPAVLPDERPAPAPAVDDTPAIADVALSAAVFRDGREPTTVLVPRGVQVVRVRLAHGEADAAFAFALERGGAGRVWSGRTLAAPEAGVSLVWLPEEVLEAGRYELLVWRGSEDPATLVAVYPFRVERD